jgi:ferredoxin
MKTRVDENLCTGCGICVDLCPEVFENGDAVSVVRVEVVPKELEAKVKESADSC